jgi:hypothetical protein
VSTPEIIDRVAERIREVIIAVGAVLMFLGFCDIVFWKSITLRSPPAWPQVGVGAMVVLFAWLAPIHGSSSTQAASVKSKKALDGHHATIFVMRHFAADYGFLDRYSYALYWWHTKEQGLTPTSDDFNIQQKVWDMASRETVQKLLKMGLMEPIGPEFRVTEKGVAVLRDEAFIGRNRRAFEPPLVSAR